MSDPDDELVAALRLVGDLLKKSAADDLKALLAGEAKLRIVMPGWKLVAPKPASPPKVAIPSASTLRAQLLKLDTEESRRLQLEQLRLNVTQARRLATDLGIRGAGRSTVEQVINMILEYFAGSADESEAERD